MTCPHCNKKFYREEEEYVKYKNRFYHKECYDIVAKEDNDKQALEDFIKKIFSLENLSPLIRRQIKNFHEQENYTYSGMLKTLNYFFIIKRNSTEKCHGIGIIPYVYEEAKDYYLKLFLLEETNSNLSAVKEERKVKIHMPQRKPFRRIKEIKLIEEDD